MAYVFERLSPQLVFIRWHKMPDKRAVRLWLSDIETSLKEADEPQYFVSDLRNGHVKDVRMLRKHGELTHHPHYGGGVTLGLDFRAEFFVNTADNPGKSGQITNKQTHEAVAQALENMEPGITDDVDLREYFS